MDSSQLTPIGSPDPTVSVSGALAGIQRLDADGWRRLGPVRRWLILVRAPVLAMTALSALTGIVAALLSGPVDVSQCLLLLIGLVGAHASNNLLNDWVDARSGLDQPSYFRRRYGAHPLADGLISQRMFVATFIGTGLVALACGVYLAITGGVAVWILFGVGCGFVLFYTWPLKGLALGEITVLLVWGPLMVGGCHYVLTGTLPSWVLALSVVAGIGPMLVIMGKHMDKREEDIAAAVRSLPVVIGEDLARVMCLLLLAVQWATLATLIVQHDLWPLISCALAAPALWKFIKAYRRPRPGDRPDWFPAGVWPLWYAAFGFRYSRDFSALLVIGLAITLAFSG